MWRHVEAVSTSATWLKLDTYIAHMDLNSDSNVGNVYTDIKVHNTPSF